MFIKVRRYARNTEKMVLFVFCDTLGTEKHYVIKNSDGTFESLTGEQAAITLTYRMGQEGFFPNGSEEIIHVLEFLSSAELIEAPPADTITSSFRVELSEEDKKGLIVPRMPWTD